MGRLISEVLDSSDDSLDYVDAFAFDLNGNRLKQTRDWGSTSKVDYVTTYSFDNNDRLLTESQDNATGDDSTTTYGYTGTQQTSKSVSVNSTLKTTQSFSYDLQGRMTMVRLETMNAAGTTIASVEETSFEYDTGGTRIASVHKIDSTNIRRTEYLTDHANPTGYSQTIMETETAADGTPIKRTVYTIGHDQISQTVYGPGTGGATWDSGTTHYFGTDGHGSVRVLYDALAAVITSAANVLQVFHYDAYGSLLNMAATSALTSYLYLGEAFDTRINQQYLRARWYDPRTGRFTTLDPFAGNMTDPQSLHKYLYVHGDPINLFDPSGAMAMGLAVSMNFHAMDFKFRISPAALAIANGILAISVLAIVTSIYGEALAAGVPNAFEYLALMVRHVQTIVQIAARHTLRNLRNASVRVFPIFNALWPEIYAWRTTSFGPLPRLLTYMGPLWPTADTNRTWVHARFGPALPGEDLDEFPYAATAEGGPPFARGFSVNRFQNKSEGAFLKHFFQIALRRAPGPFLVIFVP